MVFNLLFNCLKYYKPSEGFWTLNLKSEVWSPKSELFKSEEIWSSLAILSKVWNSKTEVYNPKDEVSPKYIQNLKPEL